MPVHHSAPGQYAHLRSELGDEDVLVVGVMPLGDISLEVGGRDVVPVDADKVELEQIRTDEKMPTCTRLILTVQPPAQESSMLATQVKPLGLELVAGEQV